MRCLDCGATLPEACNCTVDSSTSVTVAGAGSGVSPFTLTPLLAAAPGLLSLGPDGLLGEFPAELLSPPRVRAVRRSDFGITDSAAGFNVPFEDVFYDTDGFWNVGQPTRLTAPIDGLYGIGGSLALRIFSGTGPTDWRVGISIGGTPVAYRSRAINDSTSSLDRDVLPVHHERVLTAGQYAEITVRQTNVANTSVELRARVSAIGYMTLLG